MEVSCLLSVNMTFSNNNLVSKSTKHLKKVDRGQMPSLSCHFKGGSLIFAWQSSNHLHGNSLAKAKESSPVWCLPARE